MGFPFTKIVVDKGDTSQDRGFGFALRQGHEGILPIEPGTALRCPLPVPWRGTPNPNRKNASREFVPAKYEIVNFMSGIAPLPVGGNRVDSDTSATGPIGSSARQLKT